MTEERPGGARYTVHGIGVGALNLSICDLESQAKINKLKALLSKHLDPFGLFRPTPNIRATRGYLRSCNPQIQVLTSFARS